MASSLTASNTSKSRHSLADQRIYGLNYSRLCRSMNQSSSSAPSRSKKWNSSIFSLSNRVVIPSTYCSISSRSIKHVSVSYSGFNYFNIIISWSFLSVHMPYASLCSLKSILTLLLLTDFAESGKQEVPGNSMLLLAGVPLTEGELVFGLS